MCRMTGHQTLRGAPKDHDVVVAFSARGDFDEFDAARTPVALGFDPRAGAPLVLIFKVLKVALLPGPLHQPEAFGGLRRERGYLQFGGIGELPEYPFAGTRIDYESVRV